jgi:SAM-dependent methyltransferase
MPEANGMLKIDIDNINATFPKYPVTVSDKGWIYGVWFCGTAWTKAKLYGSYPGNFLKRALALFPDAADILHAPSGTITGPGVTFDIKQDEVRKPQIVGDCGAMPFENNSFDLILSDPPYSADDSEKYGCAPFPMTRFIKECNRILRPGGCLGMLHIYYPSYYRKDWKLEALIAVVTGFYRKTRMFSILRKIDKYAGGG